MVEFFKDAADQWRWRVVADNGLIVADSGEAYHNEADCVHGVQVATKLLVEAAISGKLIEK